MTLSMGLKSREYDATRCEVTLGEGGGGRGKRRKWKRFYTLWPQRNGGLGKHCRTLRKEQHLALLPDSIVFIWTLKHCMDLKN
jgi:hypothetical protein